MLEGNRRFGGTYFLHLRGISCCLIHSDSLHILPFDHEDDRRHIPPKRRLTFKGLHGVISQKTKLFLNGLSAGKQ
jgi:hypothetical protein